MFSPMQNPGSKERIRRFLRARVAKVVTGAQLQKEAGNVTEWARRVRELREDEGMADPHAQRRQFIVTRRIST